MRPDRSKPKRKYQRGFRYIRESYRYIYSEADTGQYEPALLLRDRSHREEQEEHAERQEEICEVIIEDIGRTPAKTFRDKLPNEYHPARDKPAQQIIADESRRGDRECRHDIHSEHRSAAGKASQKFAPQI